MATPKRLGAGAARRELPALLREFAKIEEPSDSIADRAVRLGVYNTEVAVLVPLADFERALEVEEIVDDLLLELAVAERLAHGPGRALPVEEVASELGLGKTM